MEKETEITIISTDDLSFLEKELSKTDNPFSLEDLSRKIAFKKSARHLSHEVKKYDPYCLYEVGDLVYKEYNEPLIVSSKGAERFEGSVILNVINKIPYDSFNCEMLEVDYAGGGKFRKYIDYMKKTKTQVLIPSNLDGKAHTSEILERDDDPRLSELPMTDKDLKILTKNLNSALIKSDKFFCWNQFWQLTEKRVQIDDKKIKDLEKHFAETKRSAETTELISHLFGKKSSDDLFDLHCLSLNHFLETKHKKSILFVSPEKWGRWLPREILDSFFKNIPLSTRRAKLPPLEEDKRAKVSTTKGFPLKIYLSWREILSGGIKVPKSVNKELSRVREYVFTEAETKKEYTVYYYPSAGVFLGLKKFFEEGNVPQGASLTLEKMNATHIKFWLKKSKKKLSLIKISYNAKEDKFEADDKEFYTYCLPHKIIHLENETLKKLFSLYDQRDKHDLHDILILIFKAFGMEGEALSLHYLRAFHLADILKHTTQEDVEKVLLDSPEFSQSEKNTGIFFYHEASAEEEDFDEAGKDISFEEAPPPEMEEAPGEELPEIGTVGEIVAEVTLQTVEEPVAPPQVKKEEAKAEPPPPKEPVKETPKEPPVKTKKEKVPKKKRPLLRAEPERAPRRRKGEKKLIEERIEMEEFELEALFAVKEDKKLKREPEIGRKEEPAKEKKEEFKPAPAETSISGIFGDMLKSALEKKDPEDKEDIKAKKKKK